MWAAPLSTLQRGEDPMDFIYGLAIVGLLVVYVGLNRLRTR